MSRETGLTGVVKPSDEIEEESDIPCVEDKYEEPILFDQSYVKYFYLELRNAQNCKN